VIEPPAKTKPAPGCAQPPDWFHQRGTRNLHAV